LVRGQLRAVALATLLLALALLGLARAAQTDATQLPFAHVKRVPRTQAIPVAVAFKAGRPGPVVPSNFLGLSFEVGSLAQIASYSERGDMVALLRSLGAGVLRFGGVTSDENIAWSDALTPRPAWASGVLDAGNLSQLAGLASQSGWRVLLTLGLAHFEPQTAAREAAAAQAALGGSLEALELGNEPDSYARHGFREPPWTPAQYQEQIDVYRRAIEAVAPGIPLAGPDSSGSAAYEQWGLSEAIYQRPALLTGHHYPLGCNEQPPPTIAKLLSPPIRRLEEASLHHYMRIAQQAEVPFRMDETNTVSCGGVAGISDTFAAALWAVNYLAKAMSTGVAGINLEGNPGKCEGYTPICALTPEDLASGQLHAQPEWYALLLAKELIGARPLRTRVRPAERPNVEANAFLAPDGTLKFELVNDDPPGSRPIAVHLHVGSAFHGASILRLTGPSPSALTEVRLGGREVAANGTWTAPARLPRAPNKNGVITVKLSPSSAALATVQPLSETTGGASGGTGG
jgi:hypothetical protein